MWLLISHTAVAVPVMLVASEIYLPSDVTSASSLLVFKNRLRLKTYLFLRCYETV